MNGAEIARLRVAIHREMIARLEHSLREESSEIEATRADLLDVLGATLAAAEESLAYCRVALSALASEEAGLRGLSVMAEAPDGCHCWCHHDADMSKSVKPGEKCPSCQHESGEVGK